MADVFTSGEEDVPARFSNWAGRPYKSVEKNLPVTMRTQNFDPLIKRPAYAYETISEWAGVVDKTFTYYHDVIRPLITDASLRSAEDAHAEKMLVSWRAVGLGRLAFANEFVSRSRSQAEELRPYTRRRTAKMLQLLRDAKVVELLRQAYWTAPIKISKGKGAPFWRPGVDRVSGWALAALSRKIRDYDDMRDALSSAAGGTPMYMTMYRRVQASRKPVPRRFQAGGRLFAGGEMRGPKIRTVKAPPMAENSACAGVFQALKDLSVLAHPGKHVTDGKTASARAVQYRFHFATDLSTCDDRISEETLVMLREEMIEPVTQAFVRLGIIESWVQVFMMAYDEKVVTREILAPARTDAERACILMMIGGVKSGERGTTWKDLECVGARCDAAVEACAAAGVLVDYISWGDDVLVMSDDPRAGEIWMRVSQKHLWKEEMDVDASFLSRHQPEGYAYFMRQVSRRINRESHEEPTSELNAALSIRASWDLLTHSPTGVPHPAAEHYVSMLRECVPKLRIACDMAESGSLLDLMRVYSGAYLPSGAPALEDARWMDNEGSEDSGFSDLAESLTRTPASYSKKLDRLIPAQISEADAREWADLYGVEELLSLAKGGRVERHPTTKYASRRVA